MAKNHHNPPQNFAVQSIGELKMRGATAIFVSSFCALLATMPALAKHSEAQKTDDKSSSTTVSCHAYQQAEDGSWTQLPCQEAGGGQTQHKPVAKGVEEQPR